MTQIDEIIREGIKVFQGHLNAVRESHNFTSQLTLAEYLGVSRSALGDWLKPDDPSLPAERNLKKIRGKLINFTEEDERKISRAYSRRLSLGNSASGPPGAEIKQSPTQPNNSPTPPDSTGEDNLAKRIGEMVIKMVMEDPQATESSEILRDPLQLIATQANDRYSIGDMPWVLTRDNFKSFNTKDWSEKSKEQFLAYTNLVLEQARGCLALLAQLEPEELRSDLLERIGRNADLLWRTFKVAGSVAPIQLIKDIDLALKCKKNT